jgi:energy-coupling factor transporter ATP-binding protein EcfA2
VTSNRPSEPRVLTKPEVLESDQFIEMFAAAHKQGQHISLVGPNGTGKTTVAIVLCEIVGAKKTRSGAPSRVVVLGIKPRDATLDKLKAAGWPVIKEWPPGYGEEHCIVWPKATRASTEAKTHRQVFGPLMDRIYLEGRQTVYIDEAAYFERPMPYGLGMGGMMEKIWTTARANKLTMIAGTQRPRNVTRSMWSEPQWVFVFPPDDEDDLKRVAEMSGRKQEVIDIADKLGPYEFLCIRRERKLGRNGIKLYVSRIEA